MKNKFLPALLLAATSFFVSAAEKTELPNRWQFQPAVNSKTLPDETLWSMPHSIPGHAKRPKGVQWNVKIGESNNLWMKQSFEIPASKISDRWILDFERINGNAIVFLNGKRVGERLGPYGTIEISKFVKPGANELILFNTKNYTDVSRTFEKDYLRYTARGPEALYGELPIKRWRLGIDKLNLIHVPVPAAVMDAWAETSWRKKELTLNLELDTAKTLQNASIECGIFDAKGDRVLTISKKNINLKKGIDTISLVQKWENPILWELDGGYLYSAEIKLKNNTGIVIDTQKFKFGFREIWVEGRNLILNGHKSRWRTEWASFGLNENSISLFKLLGRNMIYYQSNPSGWWRDWAEVFHYDQKELDLMDREGIAVLLPVPACNYVREKFFNNPEVQKQYAEEVGAFIKRYRNHPSIIAWCTAMNSFNPRSGIHPDTFGKRENYSHIQAKVLDKSFEIVKSFDQTRLAYGHAEGNLGDIASGNTYPNFAPVQEVEDWPAYWAEHGNMPWWACEYAAVYDGSYFKGKQFLLTEYAAINFGPDAYRKETQKQLERTIDLGIENKGHGGGIVEAAKYAPLYWDVQALYIKATDRAWRTWGILGWHYFNFGTGYGEPPELKGRKRPFGRYDVMKKPVTERPVWANRQFDLHAQYMQPLLIYIAGAPVHTDKTHVFYPNSDVKKQIAAVWDGPGDLPLKLEWNLKDQSGKIARSGTMNVVLKAGDTRFLPIVFKAPNVKTATDYKLAMKAVDPKGKIVSDEFEITIRPKKTIIPRSRIYVFDPAGKSMPWIRSVTPHVSVYRPGQKLESGDILILGRESIKPEMALPFTALDVKNGLKVIILEQKPEIWDAMGFRTIDSAPRSVFFDPAAGTLSRDLKESDLKNWYGSPNLLPEFKQARAYDVTTAPKSSNRNAVASTVFEIPSAAGFIPLLSCEFDMAYSPLLRLNYGKGMILFSSLDFTGREEKEPAAMTLGMNLLNYADTEKIEPKKVLTVENSCKGKETEIAKTLDAGGTVIYTNLNSKELAEKGISFSAKKIRSVNASVQSVNDRIFPDNLLRWRDELTVNAIQSSKTGGKIEYNGIFLLRNQGKGKEYFIQVSPAMLADRYKNDPARQEAIQLSVLRLKQLVSRAATHFGQSAPQELGERVTKVQKGAMFQNLDSWFIYGPFLTGKLSPEKALANVFPGEKQALEGDTNPNITYKTDDGRTLDFRKTASANPDGFIDMGRCLESTRTDAVAYAVKTIHSDSARIAMLRIGVDYFIRVYVNGKLEFEQSRNHASPKPNVFKIRIPLKKGENVIVMKVYTGSKGFGFWANLSEPGMDFSRSDLSKDREVIYDPVLKIRSPYEFFYW